MKPPSPLFDPRTTSAAQLYDTALTSSQVFNNYAEGHLFNAVVRDCTTCDVPAWHNPFSDCATLDVGIDWGASFVYARDFPLATIDPEPLVSGEYRDFWVQVSWRCGGGAVVAVHPQRWHGANACLRMPVLHSHFALLYPPPSVNSRPCPGSWSTSMGRCGPPTSLAVTLSAMC